MSGISLPRGENMSKNPITGDEIKSKINSKEYEENFDNIFRKENIEIIKNSLSAPITRAILNKKLPPTKLKDCPNLNSPTGCFCTGVCKEEWDEKRMDTIGQNGNIGYDLDAIYQQVEKDYNK
jgi:hypothetical protein